MTFKSVWVLVQFDSYQKLYYAC